jgi:hypothetical protein
LRSLKSGITNTVGRNDSKNGLIELGRNDTKTSDFIVEEDPGIGSGVDGHGPITEDVFALENLMHSARSQYSDIK